MTRKTDFDRCGNKRSMTGAATGEITELLQKGGKAALDKSTDR